MQVVPAKDCTLVGYRYDLPVPISGQYSEKSPMSMSLSALSKQEFALAELIIETVNLEDVDIDELQPDAPLFKEGLGLDSIDALEIALAISTTYGFELRSDDADNHKIFASLRSLSAHVEAKRVR
jgi:acyl carrier protein